MFDCHTSKLQLFGCVQQMTQQSNWLPGTESQAAGMEMEKLSLLGPFLGLSVFAEDNVSWVATRWREKGKRLGLKAEIL